MAPLLMAPLCYPYTGSSARGRTTSRLGLAAVPASVDPPSTSSPHLHQPVNVCIPATKWDNYFLELELAPDLQRIGMRLLL